jgi:hypothetical protein
MMSDNEMIPGAVHRSPGICLKAEENPEKTSARRLMKGCAKWQVRLKSLFCFVWIFSW